MPLFSIIVPVYKAEKYISECVDSVLAQTFEDFELILADDGSPDRCPEICDEYAKKILESRLFTKKTAVHHLQETAELTLPAENI